MTGNRQTRRPPKAASPSPKKKAAPEPESNSGAPRRSAPPRERDAQAQWSLWRKRPTHSLQAPNTGNSASSSPSETHLGTTPDAPAAKRRPAPKRLTPAAPPLAVLAIHGVGPGTGRSRAGFSRKLRALAFPDEKDFGPIWHECVWEDLHDDLDVCVSDVISKMVRGPLFDALILKSKSLARILKWMGGTAGARKILRTLDGLTRDAAIRIATKLLDIVLDFWLYLDSDHGRLLRNRLRQRIAATAQKHPQGILLLGHSLGSVIAYDLLAEAHLAGESLPVAAFVSIGAPLAWTFDIRRADNRPEAAFDSIGPIPWTNFYYPEDYIALYSPLPSDRFPSAHNIRLSLPPSSSLLNAHRAYWSDPTLAHHIRALAMLNTGLAPVP